MDEQDSTNGGICRSCWRNCGVQPDAEMLDIDKMEDVIGQASTLKIWQVQ